MEIVVRESRIASCRQPKVAVAQIGAREHFLAARALHRVGMLAALVVDWYGSNKSRLTALARLLPGRVARRALGANSAELPDERVHALNCLGLMMKLRQSVYNAAGRPYGGFLRNDAAFARALVRLDLPDHDVFFGYSYASLEMLAAEKQRGTFTVLDQIDPGREEHLLVAQEAVRWPQYAKHLPTIPEANCERNRQEWELADVIVVNSEWSRQALIVQGVADAKIEIVPLAYEAQWAPDLDARAPRSGPLKVLWLGSVCLRKGIQYLVEAARRLLHEPVEFLIAGPLEIPAAAINRRSGQHAVVRASSPVRGTQTLFCGRRFRVADNFGRLRHHPVGSFGARRSGNCHPQLRPGGGRWPHRRDHPSPRSGIACRSHTELRQEP